MGLIYKQLSLQGNSGPKGIRALFDTGSSQCFVDRDVAQQVATLGKTPYPLRFEMARETLETEEAIIASVTIDGYPLFWTFIAISELAEELILGADFFQRWKIRLDPEGPEGEDVSIDPSALRLRLG